METKQRIFPLSPRYASLSLSELKQLLNDDSPQVRSNALAALGSCFPSESWDIIAEAIRENRNRKTPWFGFITVSWVGVVVLLETENEYAQKIAKKVVDEWNEDEKQHLISWLKDYPTYVQILTGSETTPSAGSRHPQVGSSADTIA